MTMLLDVPPIRPKKKLTVPTWFSGGREGACALIIVSEETPGGPIIESMLLLYGPVLLFLRNIQCETFSSGAKVDMKGRREKKSTSGMHENARKK